MYLGMTKDHEKLGEIRKQDFFRSLKYNISDVYIATGYSGKRRQWYG